MSVTTPPLGHSTLETDRFVEQLNAHIDRVYDQTRPEAMEAFFCAVAIHMSKLNIRQKNGGPFGAVIVEYEGGLKNGKGVGKPRVIGVGANHVVPNSDPSAHAEMEAYRDAAKRKGASDLDGAVLFTSCECCPMCLSCANGSGISKIVYVNTRGQAEAIDFSDKLQYDMLALKREEQMVSIDQLPVADRARYLEKLGNHGAVVLDEKGEIYAHGDTDTRTDPTGVASVVAVRNACKKANNFHLPQGYRLITRDIPHPAGLVVADWARLLRKRCERGDDATNPAHDSVKVDPSYLVHVTDKYEVLPVVDRNGKTHIRQDSQITYRQPCLADCDRAVPTERYTGAVSKSIGPAVFDNWKIGISGGGQIRY